MLTKALEMQRLKERARWLDELAQMAAETFGEGLEVVPDQTGAAVIDENGEEVAHYDREDR